MSEELVRKYNAFSLTKMLKLAAPAVVAVEAQQADQPSTLPPLASPANIMASASETRWSKMFNGMKKERQTEVIGKAIQLVQESNYRGLRKGPLVSELRQGLKGVLPASDSAKFFLMQAAFDCGHKFMFRADRWHWPHWKPTTMLPAAKWTVLKSDGSVALETPKVGESVGVESPWHPFKARGAYKKPELVEMVRVLIGEVPPKAKADELYAMLLGKLQPLGQP